MTESPRLKMLEKLCASPGADSFAWYALAMEYRKLGRAAEAVSTFGALRERDPGYLPMYLMAGQVLLEQGQQSEARTWLEAGRQVAASKNDSKTLGELEAALADCEP